jgi:hypothetical protein
MNTLDRRESLKLIGFLFCSAILSACQSGGSRFAEMSQATMVYDTIGNGTGRTPPGLEGGGTPEGVGRWGGSVYYIRNTQGTPLFQSERFAQGVVYDGHGRVILRDGNVVRLREGQMVTFAGESLPVPPGTTFADATPMRLNRVAERR